MQFLKKLFSSKDFLAVLVVIFFGILASRPLLFEKGYFNMHDDLQMMRQFQLEKCLHDGQIPCRWVPDMGYKYGFPLFNFYPPLPYFVGQIFRQFGVVFTDTAKITFALSIIFSGLGMYFLSKEFFKRLGGIISAVFYIWAPYHAVDVYVRGAMNESWALVFFPLIFLFGYKLITDKSSAIKNIILLALSYAGLFMSHNLMIMIFTPIFIVWCLIWMFKENNFLSHIKNLILSGALSLGLSAFFTLPAIFENNLTWLKSQLIGYYDYTAHFVTVNQLLLSRFWGYGPSVWLEEDGMPFQVGHVHWILSLVIFGVWLFVYLKSRKEKKNKFNYLTVVIPFLFLVGWITSFMTHVRSTPVYQLFPFLSLVQFPWRFLTLVTFSFSFLAGAVIFYFDKFSIKKSWFYALFLCLLLVLLNWFYFLPQGGKMGKLTDEEKFSGEAWQLQLTAGIYDYLPLTAKMAPRAPQKVLAEVMKGNSTITNTEQGTDWARFTTNGDSSTIRINIFEFPNWEVEIDGQKVEQFVPAEEEWGRMWIEIPSGEHQVVLNFLDTPVRKFSNILSLVSWLGLITFIMLQFKLWKKK